MKVNRLKELCKDVKVNADVESYRMDHYYQTLAVDVSSTLTISLYFKCWDSVSILSPADRSM